MQFPPFAQEGFVVEHGRFNLHRRALIALNELPSSDQGQVLEKVAAIVDLPPSQWSSQGVKRLAGDQSLYLLRINDSLRVILREIEGAKPEIQDIVRHETLEQFTRIGSGRA